MSIRRTSLIRVLDMKKMTLIFCALAVGCGNSSFEGGSGGAKKQAPQIVPTPTPIEVEPENNSMDVEQEPPIIQDVPDNAVRKGSFLAYTEPTNPIPKQDYTIIIKVTLPSDVTIYSQLDLSGEILGTDVYRQPIGNPLGATIRGRPYRPSGSTPGNMFSFGNSLSSAPSESFDYFGSVATLRVVVPGAENLVQDVINIRSSILNEQQTLTLVFSGAGNNGSYGGSTNPFGFPLN
jgi:hypothetical protein